MVGSSRPVVVATCNLNQWALDFSGNFKRIRESILRAKEAGATFRVGPELETTGYSCEDHFLESDTITHSWEVIQKLLSDPAGLTQGILVDVGAPVLHRNVRYNCRVFLLNGKVVLIRPKIYLANDGNYRETRFFAEWDHVDTYRVEDFYLPGSIASVTGQRKVPFGVAAVAARDTVVASETCEELFTPRAPHIDLSLSGVEIIANGSGSHHQLRKLHQRVDLMRNATAKGGGCYLYANQQGCDGARLYFDGSAMVTCNGQVLAQGSQFSVDDVEVVTATVDLVDIRSYRGALNSRGVQAAESRTVPRVDVDFAMVSRAARPSAPVPVRYHTPEEELGLGPPCWMWDYLRRSKMRGYFVALSGGADSASVSTMVRMMCDLVAAAVREGNRQVLEDVRTVTRDPAFTPVDGKDLCSRILHTCYMGTTNSSEETNRRAQELAAELGAHHATVTIDGMTKAVTDVFMQQKSDGVRPDPRSKKGSSQDLAMQNIQARSRMTLSYLMAQLLPWQTHGVDWGSLLVLGTANVDEALRGYYTKYDCSAADINPIGGISKGDLRRFLRWAADERPAHLGPRLVKCRSIVEATPTAELRPDTDAEGKAVAPQTDEEDMGMSYEELGVYGDLRSRGRCGPLSMFQKLVYDWGPGGSHQNGYQLTPKQVAAKVKLFWRMHSLNRHKMTTLTPAYHAESYSPDDNRFDLRPFLYRGDWEWQFASIDALVEELERGKAKL
eukprot:TRINITY_DN26185_c0_g1_i1.p1 TRINITY_DN26185_c0_g1~~TRINITY_DN26185_c0_g1_i1.p1  ORF type:complete len:727 (+),score=191.23 TRINITY_DN26185_c0_g1_i1:60-2240(+)